MRRLSGRKENEGRNGRVKEKERNEIKEGKGLKERQEGKVGKERKGEREGQNKRKWRKERKDERQGVVRKGKGRKEIKEGKDVKERLEMKGKKGRVAGNGNQVSTNLTENRFINICNRFTSNPCSLPISIISLAWLGTTVITCDYTNIVKYSNLYLKGVYEDFTFVFHQKPSEYSLPWVPNTFFIFLRVENQLLKQRLKQKRRIIFKHLQDIFSFAKIYRYIFCFIKTHSWNISCKIDPISANKLYKYDMKKSVISSNSTLQTTVQIFSR